MSFNSYIPRVVISNIFISFVIFPVQSFAILELTPRFSLQESWLSSSTSSVEDEGFVTLLSPGFNFVNKTKWSLLNLDLNYNAELNSGLEREDQEYHEMSLLYDITHIPDHWLTRITGNVRQVSSDLDGIQFLNSGINSGSTQELKTYGISTTVSKVVNQQINMNTQLSANVSDDENSDPSEALAFSLNIDDKVSGNQIYWDLRSNFRKSMSSDINDEITDWQLGVNYRINSQYTTYLTTQLTDTSNNELNDSSTLVGLSWQPNSINSVNVAAGVRGESNTYSLSSNYRKNRMSLSLSYKEEVTSSRTDLLEQLADDSGELTNYPSLEIIPLLQQSASITLSLTGRRTNASFSYLFRKRNVSIENSVDEQLDKLIISVTRKLNRKSSLTATFQKQLSKASEDNNVEEWQFAYDRSLSSALNMVIKLNHSELRSDVDENEYKQTSLGLLISASF